ncbi:MAG: helix-turn-helix domain-containing protein [Pseudomonas sp.]|uniref:GlxA family transcriptional regulator n=1 Tax=Pseudomonas abieticivorans TaxID=2931382 RepID=UPI0020BF2652|nr:helix-turn-helix domain-containing protein [Pseudomonas sp. PIA16]MDE1164836.1 helix-turn-helix domain-containing protein [Pseudomonas sp.]
MTLMQDADTLEIAVLAGAGSPGDVLAGLTDFFARAQVLRAELGMRRLPVLRFSHWAVSAQGRERIHDTHPGAAGHPGVMFILPYDGSVPFDNPAVCEALRHWHAQGAALLAVDSGVWPLAASGLLDGREATVGTEQVLDLAIAYPAIKVQAPQGFVDGADLVTSAGRLAWLDLAIGVLARYVGATLAVETAALYRPESAQGQPPRPHPFQPNFAHGQAAVLKVQRWLQGNHAKGITLDEMAACAGLEPRTFLRKFHACTGLKPTEYCQHLRVGRACDQLASTQRSIAQVSWSVGYGDEGALRKVFLRITGYSLSDYREQFGLRHPYRPVALKGR